MRVAIFSSALWPLGSGGELATYLYAELMRGLGVDPIFILNELDEASLQRHEFKLLKPRRAGKGKYAIALDIKALIEVLRNIDVAYFVASNLELIPFVKKFVGKPVVVHVHSYYPLCPVGHMYNFYRGEVCDGGWGDCAKCIWVYEAQRRSFPEAFLSAALNATIGGCFLGTLSMADAIVFVSEAQRKLFLKNASKRGFNIDHKKTYIVYNPLPNLEFVEIEGDDLGFLGGFDPIKGFEVLFKAWHKVYPKYQQNKLYVTKGKHIRSFERVGIVVYRRLMPPTEILTVIRKVRALVVPSLSPEPAPYACVEACLYGRLLIASDIGGIPEIVGGLPGVKLTPPGDESELADALEWALSMSREEVVELGLKNREGVLSRFNNFKSAKELLKIFERVSR
jgi:glycosyltransferase involved in cell wall biosynthesis